MGIPHLPLNLRLGHQGCHGVHDNNIHCPGTNHGLRDLQRLLPIIRLGDVEIVDINPDVPGVNRI